MLAWPTAGVSIIIYIAIFILKSYLDAKTKTYYANIRHAERAMADGNKNFPSWIKDASEKDIFIKVLLGRLSQKNIPEQFVLSILQNQELHDTIMFFAGAMEKEGASFVEQESAVIEKIIILWERKQEFVG